MDTIATLQDFYKLMDSTIEPRKQIVDLILNNKPVHFDLTDVLKSAKKLLEAIPQEDKQYILALDSTKNIKLDLSYEINELEKDIFFIENSEDEFLSYLENLHKGFYDQVNAVVNKLNGIKFKSFVTDRDGTVNNYCGRYVSSVQSVYNAVFLTKFAQNTTENSVILTSAPLDNIGLADISVSPKNAFVFAGSKGREYFNLEGKRCQFPIEQKKQGKLDELNMALKYLVKKPEYEMFTLIGSGLQFKFGQTTIARQDITGTIPEDESLMFLKKIENLIKDIDSANEFFRIEDTGKDIEIILTIDSDNPEEEAKDFDKGDGVNYLDDDIGMNISDGPCLICGDTGSDVPMVPVAMVKSKDTFVVFTTIDDKLKEKVKKACPDALFVDTPDMLVTALYKLGKA